MKYNIKLDYLKNLKKIPAKRPTIVYNIINKIVSHLNINGKKKKLINVIFKFFQKYNLYTKIKYPQKDNLGKQVAENLEKNINSVQKIVEEETETLYEKKLRTHAALKISPFKIISYPWDNQFYTNYLLQGFCSIFYQSRPLFDTKKVRKGPKYYDVPFKLKIKRSQLIMLRWFSKAVKSKNLRSVNLKIQDEVENLINFNGSTFAEISKLRQHVLSNLMYSHYRWWNRKKKK